MALLSGSVSLTRNDINWILLRCVNFSDKFVFCLFFYVPVYLNIPFCFRYYNKQFYNKQKIDSSDDLSWPIVRTIKINHKTRTNLAL